MNGTWGSKLNVTMSPGIMEQCNGMKTVLFETTTAVVVTVIATTFLNTVFGAFAVLSNALSLAALFIKSTSEVPANLIIASMSATDLLIGLLVQPIYIILRNQELKNIHDCTLKRNFALIGYFLSGVSMLTICCFSLDRFFAVTFPYRYNAEVIRKRYIIAIISYWVAWLAYTLLPYLSIITTKQYHFSLAIVMTTTILISTMCYVKIYMIIRGHRRKISAMVPTSIGSEHQGANVSEKSSGREKKVDANWLKAQRRRSFTTLVILLVFVMSFIPKICTLVANLLLGDTLNVLYVSGKWSDTVIFINSSLNPIIYVIRVEDIRREIISILRTLKLKMHL